MRNEEYQKARVLLIEDNQIAQYSIITILRELGCEAVAVDHGKAGVEIFAHQPFDLVYVDIGLSDMSGYAVVSALRQQEVRSNTHATIILLTAYSDHECLLKCITSGAEGMMKKPLSIQQAKQVIDKFIMGRLVTIDGFESSLSPAAKPLHALPVVDSQATAFLMGVSEAVIDEWRHQLIETIPETLPLIKVAYTQGDNLSCRHAVHKFHGGLHYAGVPRLARVTGDFERALYIQDRAEIDVFYALFLKEIETLMSLYYCQGQS